MTKKIGKMESGNLSNHQDDPIWSEFGRDFSSKSICSLKQLNTKCIKLTENHPPLLERSFNVHNQNKEFTNEKSIRIFQWNILSDALGSGKDNFIKCPNSALKWSFRKYRILQEITKFTPDILCFQEVDHYKDFFNPNLSKVGYQGIFVKKPYSPCLDLPINSGPDGCAIFYRKSKFDLVGSRGLTICAGPYKTNQVLAFLHLKLKNTNNSDVVIATTHLKAKSGFEKLRAEEGEDILRHLQEYCSNQIPTILTGDFNATPDEKVYSLMLANKTMKLHSAYVDENNKEPNYTSWCIRGTGEYPKTLDYIWYSREKFTVTNKLLIPDSSAMPKTRLPCYEYPSDHFSLVCDLELKT